MRKFTSTQAESSKNTFLRVSSIEDVWLDPNCRDEVTRILRGLQEIYRNKALLSSIETEVFGTVGSLDIRSALCMVPGSPLQLIEAGGCFR